MVIYGHKCVDDDCDRTCIDDGYVDGARLQVDGSKVLAGLKLFDIFPFRKV